MATDGGRYRPEETLTGFAFFENFYELQSWSEDTVDPIQRSNIPLLQRPDEDDVEPGKAKIMLIHDYRGGYNEYEACQGAVVEKEMYTCEWLDYVETFVYFSHRLVSIPPPTWINTCHRNGVKVLGTFLVEPGSNEVERMLEKGNGRFWVADTLARMAMIYGFDGWLVNIEKRFPLLSWSPQRLEYFLKDLRAECGPLGKVVWYDALTALNVIWYQNTLNALNLRFAKAAGSMLTNYAWTPQLAEQGKDFALRNSLALENLYFGIDVWAQTVQTGRHRRVTYPIDGGGGTGTGFGVQKLAELGLQAGIFAPAWSFEHFEQHNKAVERSMWLGEELPTDLSCDCAPARPHHAVDYQRHPITKYVRRFKVGSSGFYHTDFQRVFSASPADSRT